MRMLTWAVALAGLLQSGPVILTSGDIGDNYYDAPPAMILGRNTWLGLFVKEGTPDKKTLRSNLAITSVSFAVRHEPGPTVQKLFDATESGVTNDPHLVVSCDEPHFTIHWAGDMDRDGRLDMLVTFSRKYSYHPRQLLLSSSARADGLVGEVARYDIVE